MGATDQNQALAEPFAHIFAEWATASWAFDFLLDTVKRLGLQNPYDQRFALTLAQRGGKAALHLTFGGWLIVGFRADSQVELLLLAEQVAWDERLAAYPYERKEGQPEIRSYLLPLSLVNPLTSDLQAAYQTTLTVIAAKFHNWKRAIPWKRHQTEIIAALFDPDKRAELFAAGLSDSELLYERHLTAFYQDVSEEGEDYVVGEAEEAEVIDEAEILEIVSEPDLEDDLQRSSTVDLSQANNDVLAPLFSQIFTDREEAEWAFDFLREICKRLGIKDPNDQSIAVTFSNKKKIRLNFGSWAIATIYDLNHLPYRVHINLLVDPVEITKYPLAKWEDFVQKDEESKVSGYTIPLEMARALPEDLRDNFEATLDYMAKRFKDWKGCPFRWAHQPEIAEAIFIPEKRNLLLTQGLTIVEDDLTPEIEAAPIDDEDEIELNQPYPLPHLAADTGLPEADLNRWLRAIERKGQAILYGPPGTGKTFVAERLARHLISGGDGFSELVQFHPAYAYEDFIQGIRPESEDGQLRYPLKAGRFLEFCQKAETRQNTCVLIIDEINRANLARVFGELMYLLEYREKEIPLAGGNTFKIPANVRLIGTMNTADRSIALVDHALRRRFAFIKLDPNYAVLRQYHEQRETGFPVEGLLTVLQRLNRTIQDEHYFVGITFFLREKLAEEIEDIWRMEIEPYLEEYFLELDKIKDFRWSAIQAEIL